MLLGVISDTHDALPAIAQALEIFKQRSVRAVLHAGDIVSPFAAKLLAKIEVPLYVIYGNNEGERKGLRSILPEITDGPVEIELGGKLVAMAHDLADISQNLAGRVDILISGHSHEAMVERRDQKLYVNPGECCGWVTGKRTVAIVDTDKLTAQIVQLPGVTGGSKR